MNAQEFVDSIKLVVAEGAVESVKTTLHKPPGRNPEFFLKELSEWYNNKNDDDKLKILEVIRLSVESSVFGFLCVLDGVRAIEETQDKGQLVLYFEKNGQQELLNDPSRDFLHDLL